MYGLKDLISMPVALTLLLIVGGCGPKLKPLSGTVTFEGGPVKAGSVTFLPKGELRALPTMANIKDGRFDLPSSIGITDQPYRIVVVGYDGIPIEFSAEGTRVFRDYRFEHVFDEITSLDIEVPASLKINKRR